MWDDYMDMRTWFSGNDGYECYRMESRIMDDSVL